ncbi:MAG: chemotaxis protein CheB [Planctomycetota bacterium]|nr:chemotaxis protein CheB [Planctomycetota bacterium]
MTGSREADLGSGKQRQPRFYVGVGASAGGLEAIEALFSTMPDNTDMAFVVVQHLSPDFKSMMVELLSKRTAMDVVRADDGMIVEPNTVYLIPPKANLTIFKGKLLLAEQDHGRGLNLPIDIFLRSLAEDQGSKAVGIVLSGTGSDGTRGVRAIKEAGGMVMVQSAESAKFDGMPRAAISTGLADFILPAEELAGKLVQYARSPHATKAEHAALSQGATDLDRIFAMLREETKVDFTHYKPSTVTRRIERRMTVNQTHDLRSYVRLLAQNPRELNTLYRELLIGVTSFFRDPEAFKILDEVVLPQLFEDLQDKRACRLWVAGCSTGEEAYSLAILCHEQMEKLGRQLDLKIFATDIDQHAIVTAGNGVYPASIVADLPRELREKYFTVSGADYQVSRLLREDIVFARHNVLGDPPFTNIDLISCRNLLIYLEPVLQEKVLDLFGFSLNPKGVLFLGSSETPGRHLDAFETVQAKWRLYRSRGRRLPADAGTQRTVYMPPGAPPERRSMPGRVGFDEGVFLERLVNALVGETVPLALVVNEQMEMVYSAGDRADLLTVPSGRAQYQVGKMMPRELSIPLTTSVQRAFRNEEDVAFTNIVFRHRGESCRFHLRVTLFEVRRSQQPLALVLLEEGERDPAVPHAEGQTDEVFDIEHGVRQRITDLEQELQFTKENLQATIEELEASNEELQATNEELLASNEELQSTNEELQSVNEELHTVNAEHQVKIVELTEMTNDLDNLLRNTRQGTLFLDENLEIRKFTDEIAAVLQIREVDIGRPLGDLSHRLVDCPHPVQLALEVQRTDAQVEREVCNDDGATFLMRVMPYEVAPSQSAGLVLTFVDISQLKHAEAELAESRRQLRDAAQLARMGSWEFEPATGKHTWSDEIFAIHDLPVGQVLTPEEGINFYAEASRPIITRVFTAACEEGTPYDEVLEIISATGKRKWVRTIGNPVIEDGIVTRITGAFQDISTLRGIEQETRPVTEDSDV